MNLSLKGRVFKKIRSPRPRPGKGQVHDLSRENILTIWFWNHVKQTINRSNNFKKIGKDKTSVWFNYGLVCII